MLKRSYKILFADDDKDIVDMVDTYMSAEGYQVEPAYDGEAALRIFDESLRSSETGDRIHLVLLDLMMPKVDGFDVCREIRKVSNVPIIILTAKTEDIDKVVGLEIGADDYIVKPFNPRELLARIRSVIRRSYTPSEEAPQLGEGILLCGDIRIDPGRRAVRIQDRAVKLTVTEFDLLYHLVKNAGKVYSRRQLLDQIWDSDYCVGERTVDVHIRRLREHVEKEPSSPKYILTVWGVGYKFLEHGNAGLTAEARSELAAPQKEHEEKELEENQEENQEESREEEKGIAALTAGDDESE